MFVDNLLAPILDISIIVALENIGPVLKASTSNELLDHTNEAKVVLYFTQRVIFSLGMGNKQVTFNKIQGPLELMELEPPQEAILLPIKFSDQNSLDSRIKNFGRDVVFIFHYLQNNRKNIQNLEQNIFEKAIEEIREFTANYQYYTLKDDEKAKTFVNYLKTRMNRFLGLRLWAQSQGTSLLHLGTLRNLYGAYRGIGALLIGIPAGITKDEIVQRLSQKHSKNEILEALTDLCDMGFVTEKAGIYSVF